MNPHDSFTHRRKGRIWVPLDAFAMGEFQIAIYPGDISEFDMIIKYRQKIRGAWSRVRTPKHIHWTVDMLSKMFADKLQTQSFIDFLLRIWEETAPITGDSQRKELKLAKLCAEYQPQCEIWRKLNEHGEYSVQFLVLLAKLLMIQEKTNLREAFFFYNLLKKLRVGEDIFGIISAATHTG